MNMNKKVERVWQNDRASHSEVITLVAHYIVGVYNCTPLKCTRGNLSTDACERKAAIQHPVMCPKLTWSPQIAHLWCEYFQLG